MKIGSGVTLTIQIQHNNEASVSRMCSAARSVDHERSKALHQRINSFHLDEEGLQLIQRQCTRAIASRLTGIWVRLQKQTRQPDGESGTSQIQHLRAPATGGLAAGITALKRMGCLLYTSPSPRD